MNGPEDLAEIVTEWAVNEPSVHALVLIGSRVRESSDAVWRADAHSDWDFQIITSNARMFLDTDWTQKLGGMKVHAYAARRARLVGLPKVAAVFTGTEADFVVLPANLLRLLKLIMAIGVHRRVKRIWQALQDLAIVIRPGFKFLKGAPTWEPFYQRVIADVPDPRINDAQVRMLAEGFVCDYVWTLRKLARGELHAAQRMLHRELAETNFRLLHELKLRRNERSFPDARRLERVMDTELINVTVDAQFNATALQAALEKSAASCRNMTEALLGDVWRWPDL